MKIGRLESQTFNKSAVQTNFQYNIDSETTNQRSAQKTMENIIINNSIDGGQTNMVSGGNKYVSRGGAQYRNTLY